MLRDGHTASAYAHVRLAGRLERLARGAVGDGGGDPTEPGRRAALDVLRGGGGAGLSADGGRAAAWVR